MPELDGLDLKSLPLLDRRFKLERLLAKAKSRCLNLSETFSDPVRLLSVCNEHRLEDVVNKRFDRPYSSGPSKNWIKVKCQSWRDAYRERCRLFQ